MNIREIDGVLTLVGIEASDLKKDGTVLIPESVCVIGESAFLNCTDLTSITLPAGVTSIGMHAFCGCTGLTSLTLPIGVTSIGGAAFYGCTGLTKITLPISITSIEWSAFYGCTSLTSITTLSTGITSIGKYAFYGCIALTSITLPNSVTSIGRAAFYGCTGLTSLTLPTDVTSIGGAAFYGCTGLTSITTLSTDVTSIGEYAFYGCIALTSITLPNSVTSIGKAAFCGCTGLISITLSAGVTEIKPEAFHKCSNVTLFLVNTDEPIELERIKQLLPANVREKVITSSAFVKARQIQRRLLVDFSATIYPTTNLSPSVFLTHEMANEIFSYNDLANGPVLSLKTVFENEPIPNPGDSLEEYKTALEVIERQQVFVTQCEALISCLQQYNNVIQESVPTQYSSFFSGSERPSNKNNIAILNVFNLVEHLIESLKKLDIPRLSAVDQEVLFSRPTLLAKIPLDIRNKMGFDSGTSNVTTPMLH